jgi:hypothetical protein
VDEGIDEFEAEVVRRVAISVHAVFLLDYRGYFLGVAESALSSAAETANVYHDAQR